MKSNKGISLVELIVVIAIMAIIAGVAIPVYTTYIKNAEDQVAANTQAEIEYAIGLECTLKSIDKPTVAVSGKEVVVTFTKGEGTDATKIAAAITEANKVITDYCTLTLDAANQDATKIIYKGTLAD